MLGLTHPFALAEAIPQHQHKQQVQAANKCSPNALAEGKEHRGC